MTVDIIIPVYNAYDELCLCVESVKKHTDLRAHRLLLINDKSTDERISPFLHAQAQEAQILVLENEKNCGFSHSVNRGLQHSENDVVLLNSDTIVTAGWLDKLIACAESDRSIGTVTPFSNNATICSLPQYLQDNELPKNHTIDTYAKIIEDASVLDYPAITTAIGFCMYIKRCVIEDVGLFDAETFGKGYGEENDFCYRAKQLGYHDALCDDTFVYHSGTMSFQSEEKKALIAQNAQILRQRYPKLILKNEQFCQQNPLLAHQQMVRLYTALQNTKKNILYVAHRSSHEDATENIGGTQFHVKDLREHLQEDFNIIELGMDDGFVRVSVYAQGESFSLFFQSTQDLEYPPFYAKELSALFSAILDGLFVDIVHVHHTKYLTLDIYEESKKRNLPLFSTLHDYYTLCPELNFLDNDGQFCLAKESDCNTCLSQQKTIAPKTNYIEKWRREHLHALSLCDNIFVPSTSVKEYLCRFAPNLSAKVRVIEHGITPLPKVQSKAKHSPQKPLRVAFVGGLSLVKGSALIFDLLSSKAKDIEWYTVGTLGDERLSKIHAQNIHHLGPYKREDLPRILAENEIDVVAILSIWPETFCYVISEALACEVPILCPNLGAPGQRVRDMACGWVLSESPDAEEVLHTLRESVQDSAQYADILQNVRGLSIKTTEAMCREYAEIYDAQAPLAHSNPSLHCKRVLFSALKNSHLGGDGNAFLGMAGKMRLQEAELQALKNSLTFRLMFAIKKVENKLNRIFRR